MKYTREENQVSIILEGDDCVVVIENTSEQLKVSRIFGPNYHLDKNGQIIITAYSIDPMESPATLMELIGWLLDHCQPVLAHAKELMMIMQDQKNKKSHSRHN